MKTTTSVTDNLDQLDVPYRFFQHPGPVHSLEQAASERNQSPEQVVRSILFRIGQGDYVMVLIAGPSQVSWPALRSYLGLSRLTMASREEVLDVTGYETGAVSPIGLSTPLRILVDESVTAYPEVSIGSGIRNSTIILKSTDLLHALAGAELGAFRKK